jgi:hypothetical protein
MGGQRLPGVAQLAKRGRGRGMVLVIRCEKGNERTGVDEDHDP